MKPIKPLRAKNETGDNVVDVDSLIVPDSAITSGSNIINLGTSTGDVTGPASATDNAAAVFDSTTGKLIKDGAAINVLLKQAVESFTTTATAAGTTTLTVASNPIQAFTGVTTQTITLPVVSTLPKTGFQFYIINNSSGALTVNSSGANLVQTITAGAAALITCVLLTGTTAASWDSASIGGSGDVVGPGSSTDEALARFDSTTGKLLQNGVVLASDAGAVTGITDITTNGLATFRRSASNVQLCFGRTSDFVGDGYLYANSAEVGIQNTGNQTLFRLDQSGGVYAYYNLYVGVDAGTDFGLSRIAANVGRVNDGSTGYGWLLTAGNSRVTGDVTNVTTTPAAITGLSATLKASRTYSGRMVLFAEAVTATDGLRIDFDGGAATAANFIAQGTCTDTLATFNLVRTSALATDMTVTLMTGASVVVVDFTISTTDAGTFIPRFAKEADAAGATTTISRGSYMTITDIV